MILDDDMQTNHDSLSATVQPERSYSESQPGSGGMFCMFRYAKYVK